MKDTTEGTLIDSILFALEQESLFMAFAGDMPLVSPQFIKTMCSIYSGKPVFVVPGSPDAQGVANEIILSISDHVYSEINRN